jgi:hypothetical protein
MAEEEDQEDTDRRPTPVRLVMEAGDPSSKGPMAENRTFLDPEDGQEWVARVSGRSTSGVLPLRTISIMEVTFYRVKEPDVPARRVLCQGDSMGNMEDGELLQLLRNSRPHAPPTSGSPTRERRRRRAPPPRRGS